MKSINDGGRRAKAGAGDGGTKRAHSLPAILLALCAFTACSDGGLPTPQTPPTCGAGQTLHDGACVDLAEALCPDGTTPVDASGNCPPAQPKSATLFYRDSDGDGYGDPAAALSVDDASAPPAGHVADGADCNDADASVHPGSTVPENTDGRKDFNCDGIYYFLPQKEIETGLKRNMGTLFLTSLTTTRLVQQSWDPQSRTMTKTVHEGNDPRSKIIATVETVFDPAGNALSIATRSGSAADDEIRTYDPSGKLTTLKRYADATVHIGVPYYSEEHTYDERGNETVLMTVNRAGREDRTTRSYNNSGRPTSLLHNGKLTTYAYDGDGRLSSTTIHERGAESPIQYLIRRTYDGAGRNTHISLFEGPAIDEERPGGVMKFVHDEGGHLLSYRSYERQAGSEELSLNSDIERSYNDRGQLTGQTTFHGDPQAGAEPVRTMSLSYDGSGSIAMREDVSDSRLRRYAYDGRGYLIAQGAGRDPQDLEMEAEYTYDDNGNLKTSTSVFAGSYRRTNYGDYLPIRQPVELRQNLIKFEEPMDMLKFANSMLEFLSKAPSSGEILE